MPRPRHALVWHRKPKRRRGGESEGRCFSSKAALSDEAQIYDVVVEYGSPAPFIAFALAMVSGTLLAIGSYVGGAITGVLAIALFGLWQFARRRGDDDRHTIW